MGNLPVHPECNYAFFGDTICLNSLTLKGEALIDCYCHFICSSDLNSVDTIFLDCGGTAGIIVNSIQTGNISRIQNNIDFLFTWIHHTWLPWSYLKE